jgi:hypothetical protein
MRRLASVTAALLLVAAASFVAPPATTANVIVFDIPWVVRVGSGYDHHIPVCLHPNYNPNGGPPWDLSSPYHTAINNAMAVWNLQGGELYFYRSNSECQTLFEAGIPYVQIGWSANIGSAVGATQPFFGCGGDCLQRAAIWLNTSYLYAFHPDDIPGRYHAQSVFTHELGHTLMLDDVNHEGDVMDQDLALGQVASALSSHDRAGYSYYYGNTH